MHLKSSELSMGHSAKLVLAQLTNQIARFLLEVQDPLMSIFLVYKTMYLELNLAK
jgi:hypothetical protein